MKGMGIEILQAGLGVGGCSPLGNSHSSKRGPASSVPPILGKETTSVPAAKRDAEALRHKVRDEKALEITSHIHLLSRGWCGSLDRVGIFQSHQLENGRAGLLAWVAHCQKVSPASPSSPLFSGMWPFLSGIYWPGSIHAEDGFCLGWQIMDSTGLVSESRWFWALSQEF